MWGFDIETSWNIILQINQFWWFLLYQYLFNYNKIWNIIYPNTFLFVLDRYLYPFYIGFYQYVRL